MPNQPCLYYEYVDTPDKLRLMIERMREAKRIAVDTEADSMHHYFAKVCLIQLAMENDFYILDPLAGLNLKEFLSVLSSKPILFHGGDYDLRMMRMSFDFYPNEAIFDTMLAAQLLGYQRFGLTSLVDQFYNVALTDLGKKTDWSRRPLTEEQLEYAHCDTRFLEGLADTFEAKLTELNRLEWHRETCARMVESTKKEKPRDEENEWRISGKRLLDRQQLAYLREIWYWRDKESQDEDVPPFKVLQNEKIIDLVIWVSNHPFTHISKGPKLPRNCTGKRLENLEKAVEAAANTAKSDWPFHKQSKPAPQTDLRIKPRVESMILECAQIAEELGIAAPVIASRSVIKAIAHGKPATVEEMMACSTVLRWQAELLFPSFSKIIKKYP